MTAESIHLKDIAKVAETKGEIYAILAEEGDVFMSPVNTIYMSYLKNIIAQKTRYVSHLFFKNRGRPPNNLGLLMINALNQSDLRLETYFKSMICNSLFL